MNGSPLIETKFGNARSKIPIITGSRTDVYTVLPPNSLPISKNPTISKATFKIMVIAEIGSGIKFPITIARPDILPTDTVLGTRKKKTAAATMAVANVIAVNSLINDICFFINF